MKEKLSLKSAINNNHHYNHAYKRNSCKELC